MKWYDFLYSKDFRINKKGQLKNIKTGTIIKVHPDKDGYIRTNIWINGIRRNFKIHRMIAIHFIPNPENKPQVNHKDGNKANNSISNLEWCTAGENQRHAIKTGLKCGQPGILHHHRKINENTVYKMFKLAKTKSVTEIAKILNLKHGHVYLILRKKRWQHLTKEL